MNPLFEQLARRIKAEGPITIADYMSEALGNPDHGYYMKREPFGKQGDFITAPEVSQMFGELIGLWIADYWLRSGAPKKLTLVELGPGRGTLMADALRAMKMVPGLIDALSLHLVEISPRLKELQQEKLAPLTSALSWHADLDDVIGAAKNTTLIIIANEFFDALPIRQLVRTSAGWMEKLLGVDEAGASFTHLLAPAHSSVAALLAPDVANAPEGSLAEVSPLSLKLMGKIAAALKTQNGAALIIDYGTATSAPGDSLQALARHKYTDPFLNPGEADLTAHVDFAALSRAAAGSQLFGPLSQRRFLLDMGIETRAANLKQQATRAEAEAIDAALRRLTGKDEMGALFKVLGLCCQSGPLPAGFTTPHFAEDN